MLEGHELWLRHCRQRYAALEGGHYPCETGLLVDFFDVGGLAASVCKLLEDPKLRAELGSKARKFAQGTYDLQSICLPRQLEWVESLAGL